jgi:hypothetical protein
MVVDSRAFADDHSRLSPVLFSRSRISRAGVGPLDAMSPVRV